MDNTSLVQWGEQTLLINVKLYPTTRPKDKTIDSFALLAKYYGATTPKQYPKLTTT